MGRNVVVAEAGCSSSGSKADLGELRGVADNPHDIDHVVQQHLCLGVVHLQRAQGKT